MTEINDKIEFRRFLTRVFISNSGISSRRVLAFVFSIVLIIQSFMHYEHTTLKLLAIVILILLGLTTASQFFQTGKSENKEEENGKNTIK
jgi:hypothetical protein